MLIVYYILYIDNMNATLKQCGDAILQRCVNAQMQQMQHCNQNKCHSSSKSIEFETLNNFYILFI